jgi:hypothetical protein
MLRGVNLVASRLPLHFTHHLNVDRALHNTLFVFHWFYLAKYMDFNLKVLHTK